MTGSYAAPLQDMNFLIRDVFAFDDLVESLGLEEMGSDLAAAIFEEAGKLGGEVIAAINHTGDVQGSRLENGIVRTPNGFTDAYAQFVAGGWNGIHLNDEFGGQEIPYTISTAASEIWCGANMAFSLCPVLTQGAIEAISQHASPELKNRYLPKLVSGEWTGTMNLTEPQSGSDLSGVRTKAVRQDNHYLITGQKVFVSWGDHDLAENIIHLVLARTPDAPTGTKGISLFVVPKILVSEDGELGSHNDLKCVSLEHKLGLHASPTAVMSYGDDGGAIGYLVGEECHGLDHMFTMMNSARLSVGLEGVGVAERALQQARSYAGERIQGTGMVGGERSKVSINQHPDVRRMLALMKTKTEAMRALTYHVALSRDIAAYHPDKTEREFHTRQVDLLTPVVKAWCTDGGLDVADLAIQVHGGIGYVEETGITQNWRDLRVASIYEGTNGIQAIDLVNRKVVRDNGLAIGQYLERAKAATQPLGDDVSDTLHRIRDGVRQATNHLEDAVEWILAQSEKYPENVLAAASTFLTLFGDVAASWLMLRTATIAEHRLATGEGDPVFNRGKIQTSQLFVVHFLATSLASLNRIIDGSDCLLAFKGGEI